jgi:hypothetical protein
MRTYDLLFKVPIAGPPSPDGIRDTDELFMRAIDGLVDQLMEEKGIPFKRLPQGERERWIDIVKEQVRAHPGSAKLF